MSGTHKYILLINIYSGIGMDDCMLCACVDVNARAGRTLACGALLSSPRRCRRTQACATAERAPRCDPLLLLCSPCVGSLMLLCVLCVHVRKLLAHGNLNRCLMMTSLFIDYRRWPNGCMAGGGVCLNRAFSFLTISRWPLGLRA